MNWFLSDQSTLVVVDVQERLFPKIDRAEAVGRNIERLMRGYGALALPVVMAEQVPQKLGPTIPSLRLLYEGEPIEKSRFSCAGLLEGEEFVVVGIEAHVCVLQTVKDLLAAGKRVAVANDAVGSRSIFDYSTALAEMRDAGARISSVEILLFELLRDANHPNFSHIAELIR